jgi:hypothetical protein
MSFDCCASRISFLNSCERPDCNSVPQLSWLEFFHPECAKARKRCHSNMRTAKNSISEDEMDPLRCVECSSFKYN